MTSFISYLLKTLDYYFLLVLTDEWLNISAAVRPSSTLSPSHQHVTLHVRSRARRRVMCESWLVHVCRRLLDSLLRMIKSPRSGYSKLAEVKSSAIKKLFLLCLAFSFWRETTSLFIQSSVFTFILWERALLSCRRMMYGAFIDLLFRIINKNHLCEICPALLLIFDANMNCVSLFLPSLSLHSSLLSPGRHHRRELWARRTHQEPQRERYR